MTATTEARTAAQGTGHTAPDSPVRVSGTLRYWAAAKAEAGAAEESYLAATLAEALDQARARHADRPGLLRLLGVCSYLVDGDPVGTRDHAEVRLRDGGSVEVLPPFAGG
ncbi:MoaD/ThiS family protein [Kitasatospora sp. MBT63]|uniref:MoaD/ThiS family protein n=1 Tax=Kitasatospora sp. MBT63 TaxID=1444768 RepID=UPI0009E6FEEF|nr:MoaD/ThiS family protein [Kitasatospora sp. MBT63]